MSVLLVLGLLMYDAENIVVASQKVRLYSQVAEDRHVGGAPYFNDLDYAIGRDEDIMRALTDTSKWLGGDRAGVVVSGRFGMEYIKYAKHAGLRRPFWLRGGLRYEAGPSYNGALQDFIRTTMGVRDFVFIDDSLYKGRTMDWVRNLILMRGGRWNGAVVAYDGSREQLPNVASLYRYFHEPYPVKSERS